VWVTAQALTALEGKPLPLRPAPRRKARAVTAAAAPATTTTHTAETPRPRAKAIAKHRHRRHAAQTTNRLGVAANEIEVTPAAQTTTTTAPGTSSKNGGKGSYWPFVFAVLIGVAMLAGLRLAWRRG
jgi:hypothetical protein